MHESSDEANFTPRPGEASATMSSQPHLVDTQQIAPDVRTPRVFTVEHLLYSLIFLVAIGTRFWDLGSRALHHDESEHAYYSWIYAIGGGYQHDPLLHGPFLFHVGALMFWLFGASDSVARAFPALVGVMVVMLPWLLRSERLLGRWGALTASVLLLISPTILYYSRFLRHDIYCLGATFLLFIAVVRYVDFPERKWAILGGVAIGVLFCTKEVSFIVVFLFVAFLAAAVAYRVAPALFAVAAGTLVALGVVGKLVKIGGAAPLPAIPWNNPTGADIWRFTTQLIQHPLVIGALGVLVVGLVIAIWVLDRAREPELGCVDGLLRDVPDDSTAAAFRELLRERRGLSVGIVLCLGIFVLLYTSLFTNMDGLASGTFGALGYWLGQQNVQRGAEPWFYYLLLLPQYEFIGVMLFPFLTGWFGVRALTARRRGEPLDSRFYLRALLIWWAIGMFAVLSWAGEKMPWLTVHVALPLILLAASYIGAALSWIDRRRQSWHPSMAREMALIGGAVVGLFGVAFLVTAWASDGPWVQRQLPDTPGAIPTATWVHLMRPGLFGSWWTVVGLPWLAVIALIVVAAVRLGPGRTTLMLVLATTAGLSLLQIHTEWRMTYRQGDVPKDMLMYVQTSPDVPLVTGDLTQMSQELTGAMGLEVWYDDLTSWPFNWYLRDFNNRRDFGSVLPTNQPMTAPVVLVADQYVTPALTDALQNYTFQDYPMRWWFPENETYRRFAYAPDLNVTSEQNFQDQRQGPFSLTETALSALRSVWAMRHPQEQAKIFRLVAFRETPSQLYSFNFRVYVRNDLLPTFNNVRYSTNDGAN